MFIYRIFNKINFKNYVGKCIRDEFYNRYPKNEWWRSTKNELLSDEYKIFGHDNFIVEILIDEISDEDKLLQIETLFIERFNSLIPNGYNKYKSCKNPKIEDVKDYILYNYNPKVLTIIPELLQPLNLDGEIWKPIKNYQGIYEISNFGRAKSLPRTILVTQYRNGKKYDLKVKRKEKILKPSLGGIKEDYYRICLHVNNVEERRYIQCLVAEAFIPNPNPLNFNQVNHIDCDKLNNNVENLEWTNNSGNQKHAFANGLNKPRKGEENNRAKLKEIDVINIRNMYSTGEHSHRKIAKIYNVDPSCIGLIVNRKNWKHVK